MYTYTTGALQEISGETIATSDCVVRISRSEIFQD